MAYATYADVEARMGQTLSESERARCTTLLNDAATMIDQYNSPVSDDIKALISCRMVIRAIGTTDMDIPIGATQGSMSGLGFSQSFTVSGGATQELYFEAKELKMLGVGNKIGAYSPIEKLAEG